MKTVEPISAERQAAASLARLDALFRVGTDEFAPCKNDYLLIRDILAPYAPIPYEVAAAYKKRQEQAK